MRLIDANAVLKEMKETYCTDCNNYNCVLCSTCEHMDDMDFIEDAPTVDAQPVKHGKWVKYPSIYRCSNCGNPKGMKKPYCELCGAQMSDHFANAGKMVEEANEDEQAQ